MLIFERKKMFSVSMLPLIKPYVIALQDMFNDRRYDVA
jgi:hypothetical protein